LADGTLKFIAAFEANSLSLPCLLGFNLFPERGLTHPLFGRLLPGGILEQDSRKFGEPFPLTTW